MDKFNILLAALKQFFTVNNELRSSLNQAALETHSMSLDQLIEKAAEQGAGSDDFEQILDEVNYWNADPHSITEQEMMYDFVYDFEIR